MTERQGDPPQIAPEHKTKRGRFIPLGADGPSVLLVYEEITKTDIEQAVRAWDELVPEFREMLGDAAEYERIEDQTPSKAGEQWSKKRTA